MSFDLILFFGQDTLYLLKIGRQARLESDVGVEVTLFHLKELAIHLHFDFGVRFPMLYPQLRNVFTTLGVIAAVNGTLMKTNDL